MQVSEWRNGSAAHDEALAELGEWWDDLLDGCGSHVVLVRAPSGWGRSTLLDGFARHVRSHPEPIRVLEVPTGDVAGMRLGPGAQVEWLTSLLEPDLQDRHRELAGVDRVSGRLNLGLGVTGLLVPGLLVQVALLLATTGVSVATTAMDRSPSGPASRAARLASVIARVSVGIPVVVLIDDADELSPELATAMVRGLVERVDGQVLVVVAVDRTSSELAQRLRALERDAVLAGRVHALDAAYDMDESVRLELIEQLVPHWPRAAKWHLATRARNFAEVFQVLTLDGAASLAADVDDAVALNQLDTLIAAAGWRQTRPTPSWAALIVSWVGGLLHREQLTRVLAAIGKPAELGDQVTTVGPWVRLADPGALAELHDAAHGRLDHERQRLSRVIIGTAAELIADPGVDRLSRVASLRAVEQLVAAGTTRLQAAEVDLVVTLARDLAQLGDVNHALAVTDTALEAAHDAGATNATAELHTLRLQLFRLEPEARGQAQVLADRLKATGDTTTVGLEARVWATITRLEDSATRNSAVGEAEILGVELTQHAGPVATWWRLLLAYYLGRGGHPGLAQNLLRPVRGGASQDDSETAEWILRAIGGPQADLRLYLTALQAAYERLPLDAPDEDRLRVEAAIAGTSADLARYRDALPHAQQELRLRTRLYGPDHPDTLRSRHNLAKWTHEAGHLGEARRLFEALLPDMARVLGPDHPGTLTIRHNIAICINGAGRHEEARRLLEELLPDRARVLSPDHPDTLFTRDSIASCIDEAGRHEEARRLFEELLADMARVLGPDHPRTLTTRGSLASCMFQARRLDEAQQVLNELLPEMARVLGPDHPRTLKTRARIASCIMWAGTHEERRLLQHFLPDWERVLGPNHSAVIARGDLAAWVVERADKGEERRLLEELVTDMGRVLGPDHPDTLDMRHGLVTCYHLAGRHEEAYRVSEELLADMARVLGPDHPNTVNVRRYLERESAD